MAKRKNLNEYERAVKLYTIFVLNTDEKRKEFEALKESEKESRVNGYRQRNQAVIVGDMLKVLKNLSREELSKLRGHLNNYLKEVDNAEKNINERQIERLEKQKAELKKQHENELKKIDAQIEKLING